MPEKFRLTGRPSSLLAIRQAKILLILSVTETVATLPAAWSPVLGSQRQMRRIIDLGASQRARRQTRQIRSEDP